MSKLLEEDLLRIVANLPSDVRAMMKSDPSIFIGGGFIRAIIAGEKPSDIDFFGPSTDALSNAAHALGLQRYASKIHKSQNAFTVLAPNRIPTQFITRWMYDEPHKALDSFDFTIAMAVVWCTVKDKTVTWHSDCHERFYPDLAAKRLVYAHPNRNEDARGSLMRVRKFLSRGYTINAKSLGGTIARLVAKVEVNKVVQFGETHEQGLTRVITALLREVDPLMITDSVEINEVENE